jgi:hypothetical protein
MSEEPQAGASKSRMLVIGGTAVAIFGAVALLFDADGASTVGYAITGTVAGVGVVLALIGVVLWAKDG